MADIHGYSRLMSMNEEETSNRVDQAVALIRQLTADYGGQIKNIAGDGVLALFDNVSNCINFAIAMQQEFVNDTVWNSDSEAISFRIGINVGEVREGQSGLQGHAINVAARIQTLAKPGGICISKAVLEVARNIENRNVKSIGTPDMKNISEPIEVFEIEPAGLTSAITNSAPPIVARNQEWNIIPDSSVAVLPFENLSGRTSVCAYLQRGYR